MPLQIAFHTGMRAAEVCGLTWDCVDFDNRTIKVERILVYKCKGIFDLGTPKTPSSYRSITIGETLIMDIYSHVTKQMSDNTVDIFENMLKQDNEV